ncbi:MAG: hypothetical protein ACFFD2_12820 [Promethearchaeota archaeon]
MIVHIPRNTLAKCKNLVQEFTKKHSEFKEVGGYLIGSYDGNFIVKEFILDINAESTPIRIKLSAECFQQVEEYLAKSSHLLYIGTWHVHPGKLKPIFSSTDQSTLFLEKMVIETDNPKEFKCPRIHLIFSEDLTQISAYTMHISLDYQLNKYWTLEKQVNEVDINSINNIIEKSTDIKKQFQKYKKTKDLDILNNCFSILGNIREDIDQLIDLMEDISDFKEISSIIYKERKNIEKDLKYQIKNGEPLGIITLNENEKVNLIQYRPHFIKEYQEGGTLLGFWKHFPISKPPIALQEVFFANFFRKLEADSNNLFIYILSGPTDINFYGLKILKYSGISFKEVQITLEEKT